MATFGNLHNDRKDSDIFNDQKPARAVKAKAKKDSNLTKKYQAEPGVIPGQRPAPWLGRHIFGVLTLTSLALLIGILLYKYLGGN